jgi:hypothetical protein
MSKDRPQPGPVASFASELNKVDKWSQRSGRDSASLLTEPLAR